MKETRNKQMKFFETNGYIVSLLSTLIPGDAREISICVQNGPDDGVNGLKITAVSDRNGKYFTFHISGDNLARWNNPYYAKGTYQMGTVIPSIIDNRMEHGFSELLELEDIDAPTAAKISRKNVFGVSTND